MKITETKFLDCWDGTQKQFNKWILGPRNAPKSLPILGGCLSADFPDGEWWPDEVDLNAVANGNMSIDSKSCCNRW